MGEAGQRLVVVVSEGANREKTTLALTVANAAVTSGMEVAIFLAADGVDLGRKGVGDLVHFPPFKPLASLVETFLEKGGLIWICGPSADSRGVRVPSAEGGMTVTGVGPLIEWISDGAATLCL